MDLLKNSRHRTWGRLHYHGPLCWWCLRMAAVRYAWLNVPGFVKHVCASTDNQVEAALASLAYVSLREEGRAQVSASMIQSRVALFHRLHATLPAILAGQHWQIIPLCVYKGNYLQEYGNPIEKQYEICELHIDGSKRLGVKIPAPRGEKPARPAILERANMGPFVATSNQEDLDALVLLVQQAPDASRAMPEEPKHTTDDDPAEEDAAPSSGIGGEEEHTQPAPWARSNTIVFPKGRLGTGMQKIEAKLQGIVLSLGKADWRHAIKDTIVRGMQRAGAGLEKELLQKSEYPALMELNAKHLQVVQHLLDLGAAATQYGKDEKVSNVVGFKGPLECLREYKASAFQGASSFSFDAELSMLLARLGDKGLAIPSGIDLPHQPLHPKPRGDRVKNLGSKHMERPSMPPARNQRLWTCIRPLGISKLIDFGLRESDSFHWGDSARSLYAWTRFALIEAKHKQDKAFMMGEGGGSKSTDA